MDKSIVVRNYERVKHKKLTELDAVQLAGYYLIHYPCDPIHKLYSDLGESLISGIKGLSAIVVINAELKKNNKE